MSISRPTWCLIGVVCVLGLFLGSLADAKKRRSGSSSSFKILQVTPSPLPFEVGNGDLTFSTVIKIPSNVKGRDVLEITTLITSPTQRSMRFLTRRVLLASKISRKSKSRISTDLIWDGKDQTQALVEPGMYRYEVRAKLMVEKGADIRTRMVSRRSRGMVEVRKYDIPEPPPSDIDTLQQSPESDVDNALIGEEETAPIIAVEPAADEVEMLLDESTSHPLPEPGEESEGSTEEGEVLEVPQED